jgi:hypothetical protein
LFRDWLSKLPMFLAAHAMFVETTDTRGAGCRLFTAHLRGELGFAGDSDNRVESSVTLLLKSPLLCRNLFVRKLWSIGTLRSVLNRN